jgi:hypothetical protein
MSTSTLVAGPLPKIGRTDLAQIPVPEPTRTQRPVPHHEIVEALVETLSFRHIGGVGSGMRDDRTPVVEDDKDQAERLADSTGNDVLSSGGSRGEWEGFILSGIALQASRLCRAVSSAKSGDLSARNRDRCLLSSAAPRNNTPRIRAEVREIPPTNDLESFQCVHVGIQGTRPDPAVQGDREAGRIPGDPVLAVVLACTAVSTNRPFPKVADFLLEATMRAALGRMG